MRRNAFKMKLKPGFAQAYKQRHDEIFPELRSFLLQCGILDYSIYLDEATLDLYAYQVLSDDFDESRIPDSPIVKKWWAFMADIMETNEDHSPIVTPLQEVFHLEK